MIQRKVIQVRRNQIYCQNLRHFFKKRFNYDLDYSKLNLRQQPQLYRVGVGEQGVLLVEPYKSEILPFWRFKTPIIAMLSSKAIYSRFNYYRNRGDFIGMDMARKFLQMGYTRSRRYANHSSGKKYASRGELLPFQNDLSKTESAEIFWKKWKQAESDPLYIFLKRFFITPPMPPSAEQKIEIRVELASAIPKELERQKLTHVQAAKKTGVGRTVITAITNGNLQSISTNRLIDIAKGLGLKIHLKVA